jgi:hypothetical protein
MHATSLAIILLAAVFATQVAACEDCDHREHKISYQDEIENDECVDCLVKAKRKNRTQTPASVHHGVPSSRQYDVRYPRHVEPSYEVRYKHTNDCEDCDAGYHSTSWTDALRSDFE